MVLSYNIVVVSSEEMVTVSAIAPSAWIIAKRKEAKASFSQRICLHYRQEKDLSR